MAIVDDGDGLAYIFVSIFIHTVGNNNEQHTFNFMHYVCVCVGVCVRTVRKLGRGFQSGTNKNRYRDAAFSADDENDTNGVHMWHM